MNNSTKNFINNLIQSEDLYNNLNAKYTASNISKNCLTSSILSQRLLEHSNNYTKLNATEGDSSLLFSWEKPVDNFSLFPDELRSLPGFLPR